MAREVQSRANADINPVSEQSIIGIILMKPDLYNVIKVRINDFADERLRVIYQAMADLTNEGVEIDTISLVSHLMKDNKLADAGGPGFIAGMGDNVGTTANWEYHQEMVINASLRRQLNSLINKIKNDLTYNNICIKDYLQTVNEKLNHLIGYGNNTPNMAQEIKEWCLSSSGIFTIKDIYQDLGINQKKTSPEEYRKITKNVAVVLVRLVKQGFLEKVGKKRGEYRRVDDLCEGIDFLNVNPDNIFPIRWPFNLDQYVNIYSKNIIVIAGASNAGKTAFLLNTIQLNQDQHPINYFSSEMGAEELNLRLRKFPQPLTSWKFTAKERSENFSHAIHPDQINIIDYLELTDNFYAVGGEIRAIHDRLNKGLAIIAIQKKTGADYGRGGEFTLEKARLYLSMDPGKLIIKKAKNWAKPTLNPNNMIIAFKLTGGCQFHEPTKTSKTSN